MNNLEMTIKETDSMFTVDARGLHEWLEVRRDFSSWFKDQVKRAKMVEGIHYEVIFTLKGENSRGRPAREYMVTVSAAKHIGMMSNTDRGDQVRQYFEACEDKLKEVIEADNKLKNPHEPMDELEMLAVVIKSQLEHRARVKAIEATVDTLRNEVRALEARSDINDNYVTISGFLSLKKIKGKTGEEIRVLGIQVAKYCKENGIKIAKVPDSRRGQINAYPKEVLEMLIGDVA